MHYKAVIIAFITTTSLLVPTLTPGIFKKYRKKKNKSKKDTNLYIQEELDKYYQNNNELSCFSDTSSDSNDYLVSDSDISFSDYLSSDSNDYPFSDTDASLGDTFLYDLDNDIFLSSSEEDLHLSKDIPSSKELNKKKHYRHKHKKQTNKYKRYTRHVLKLSRHLNQLCIPQVKQEKLIAAVCSSLDEMFNDSTKLTHENIRQTIMKGLIGPTQIRPAIGLSEGEINNIKNFQEHVTQFVFSTIINTHNMILGPKSNRCRETKEQYKNYIKTTLKNKRIW